MEVTFNFTEEELVELAKMTYVSQFVFDSSGRTSKGYKYPNTELFLHTLRLFNKTVLQYLPDNKYSEADEKSKKVFTHTMQMEEEMMPMMHNFIDEIVYNRICQAVTQQEHRELYNSEAHEVYHEDSPYDILYKRNKKNLENNGLKNLRLVFE